MPESDNSGMNSTKQQLDPSKVLEDLDPFTIKAQIQQHAEQTRALWVLLRAAQRQKRNSFSDSPLLSFGQWLSSVRAGDQEGAAAAARDLKKLGIGVRYLKRPSPIRSRNEA
jgi:hypothetical protein